MKTIRPYPASSITMISAVPAQFSMSADGPWAARAASATTIASPAPGAPNASSAARPRSDRLPYRTIGFRSVVHPCPPDETHGSAVRIAI
ncbi:hypothetical protein LUX33_45735 [Actinomadura madurae]|uniref:hypothetical protein n=1 Tax=Actinomadura madurae TaxID=1993 RepID=UPI0020D23F89|nr:hypothetical protein [Actinomadura madurae]MCP9954959.1 hypothetical protein [Actinomadura madurae]MCP9971696.1 hypothetical protein [Actinomadura madurae]